MERIGHMMMWDMVLLDLNAAQHSQVESTVAGNIAPLDKSMLAVIQAGKTLLRILVWAGD